MTFLLYPLTTEKAVGGIEKGNKLTFVVSENATKKDIAEEFQKLYGEKPVKVTVMNSMRGGKKAVVRLGKKGAASDIAARLKII